MALGRGLGDILSEVEEAYEKDLSHIDNFELEAQGARVEELSVESITPNPFQPRKHFDEQALQELGEYYFLPMDIGCTRKVKQLCISPKAPTVTGAKSRGTLTILRCRRRSCFLLLKD